MPKTNVPTSIRPSSIGSTSGMLENLAVAGGRAHLVVERLRWPELDGECLGDALRDGLERDDARLRDGRFERAGEAVAIFSERLDGVVNADAFAGQDVELARQLDALLWRRLAAAVQRAVADFGSFRASSHAVRSCGSPGILRRGASRPPRCRRTRDAGGQPVERHGAEVVIELQYPACKSIRALRIGLEAGYGGGEFRRQAAAGSADSTARR